MSLRKKRPLPEVRWMVPPDGYCVPLADYFDTVVETHNRFLDPTMAEYFENARQAALARPVDQRVPEPIELGGETFMLRPHGVRGTPYVFGDDQIMIFIRPIESNFPISVRYLAAGLWQTGLDPLRRRTQRLLDAYFPPKERRDFERATRVDYAFDFYSPAFTDEMTPRIAEQVVALSGVKTRLVVDLISVGMRTETMTIGMRGSPLSIQVYDKGREIREASGKEWMVPIWERGGAWKRPPDGAPIHHVWRLEIRFDLDWVADRGVRTIAEVQTALAELLTEALTSRRLTVPSSDPNRARWPSHPLWSAARAIKPADAFAPIGRTYTKRRLELSDDILDGGAGSLRTAAFLRFGDAWRDHLDDLMGEAALRLYQDEHGADKDEQLRRRYAFVDAPR
jgi:hypothetical protein